MATPENEKDWLKFEYVGVPPGHNARCVIATKIAGVVMYLYTEGWPGNHPGALIASGTSNAGGNIHLADSPDLGMDLPDSADANYPTGAKIWLVPSSCYNSATNSVTCWPPATDWLFEHNLITYDDTDV